MILDLIAALSVVLPVLLGIVFLKDVEFGALAMFVFGIPGIAWVVFVCWRIFS